MESLAALICPALRIGTQAHYRGIRQVSLQAVLFGSLLTRKLALFYGVQVIDFHLFRTILHLRGYHAVKKSTFLTFLLF